MEITVIHFDVPEDYVPAEDEVFYTHVNDIVVENNYVNDSWMECTSIDGCAQQRH